MTENVYRANLDSALACMKIGQKGLAADALKNALDQVPENEKVAGNGTWLRIMTSMVSLAISEGDRAKAVELMEEGLQVNDGHADLLFLKSLLVFDMRDYEEVLILLSRYLIGLEVPGSDSFEYQYSNDETLGHVFDTMIPESFRGAEKRTEILETVRRISRSTNFPLITRLFETMELLSQEA